MTATKTVDWLKAMDAVNNAASILIVTHLHPDGDAIGSMLGLANALRERGKTITTAVDGGTPDVFNYVPGADQILPKLTVGEWELLISVDASDEPRTGLVGEYGRAHSQKVINLDHHATNTLFGDFLLVIPHAVSATEVVYHWLMEIGHPISTEVAVPLLTGLVTDTIAFRTSNVNVGTLGIAQKLIEAGASLTEITQRALDNKSYNSILLWRQAMQSVRLEGQVIAAVVTQQDIKEAGLREMTDGGLVGLLSTVNEAMIAVVYKETEEHLIELSFRSKPGYDVARVAFALGGGGHKQASGATIDGPMEAAQARVMPLLQEAAVLGKLTIV